MSFIANLIGGATLVVSSIAGLTSSTVTYTADTVVEAVSFPVAQAAPLPEPPPETVEGKISRIAKEVGIASTTLYNLAFSESTLGKNRVGDGGKSCGVVHFHKDYYPVENSKCDDDDYILTRAAQMIKAGIAHKFSPCNCISTARNLGAHFPKGMGAEDFVPNTTLPNLVKGDLVLFRYKNGLRHVAVYQGMSDGLLRVKEGNYKPCKAPAERLVSPDDYSVIGYWH